MVSTGKILSDIVIVAQFCEVFRTNILQLLASGDCKQTRTKDQRFLIESCILALSGEGGAEMF
jgi:hypothetical protein